jgi:hypothetical protein
MYKGRKAMILHLSRIELNSLFKGKRCVSKSSQNSGKERVTKNKTSLWQEGRFLPLSSQQCPFGTFHFGSPNKTNGTTTFVVKHYHAKKVIKKRA